MFGNLHIWEILVILVVVLVLFGTKKLPEVGSSLGRAIKNFKKAAIEPEEIDITPTNSASNAKKEEEKEKNS